MDDILWWIYMLVYNLIRNVYWYVFVWKFKFCLSEFVRWTYVGLYTCQWKCCIVHVWMAPGKINYTLFGSPSLNKLFELNWLKRHDTKYLVVRVHTTSRRKIVHHCNKTSTTNTVIIENERYIVRRTTYPQ